MFSHSNIAISTKKINLNDFMNFNLTISIIIIFGTLLMLILLLLSSKTHINVFHRLYNALLKKNFKDNWRFFSITQFNCLLVLYILCRNSSIGIFIHNMYLYIFATTPDFNVIPLPIVIFTLGMSCLFSVFKMKLDRIEKGKIYKLSLFFFICLFIVFLWAMIAFFVQSWGINMNGFNLQIGYFLSILVSIIEHCIDSSLFQYSGDGFFYKGGGLLNTVKSINVSDNLNTVPYNPDQGNSNNSSNNPSNNSSNNPSYSSSSLVWSSSFYSFSPELKAQLLEQSNRKATSLLPLSFLKSGGLNILNCNTAYIRKITPIFAELQRTTGLLFSDTIIPEMHKLCDQIEKAKISCKKYPNVLQVYDSTIENVTNKGIQNTKLYDKEVAKRLAHHKATVDQELEKMNTQKEKVFSLLDQYKNGIFNHRRMKLSQEETNLLNRFVYSVKGNIECDIRNMTHLNNNLENQTPPHLKYNDDVD